MGGKILLVVVAVTVPSVVGAYVALTLTGHDGSVFLAGIGSLTSTVAASFAAAMSYTTRTQLKTANGKTVGEMVSEVHATEVAK